MACSTSARPHHCMSSVTLIDCRHTDKEWHFLPLQGRHDLLDFAALPHLEEVDVSNHLCRIISQGGARECEIYFSNADCLKLAELTTLQTLNVSLNAHITDSGLKVRTFPLFCGIPTGSHSWTPDVPGLRPLYNWHMRSCVKAVAST